jgi:hypothetical protein
VPDDQVERAGLATTGLAADQQVPLRERDRLAASGLVDAEMDRVQIDNPSRWSPVEVTGAAGPQNALRRARREPTDRMNVMSSSFLGQSRVMGQVAGSWWPHLPHTCHGMHPSAWAGVVPRSGSRSAAGTRARRPPHKPVASHTSRTAPGLDRPGTPRAC